MSRQKPQLAQLLFSSSQHEDTENHSHQQSFDEEIENCEQDFLRRVAHEDWRSPDHVDTHFMPFNGPSVEFSQNFSQNSLMLSHRQDEDATDYNQGYRYKKLLDQKKREEEQFNEVLDKELTAVKQELERSRFEVTKLQGLIKGWETKVKRKDEEINELDENVASLQEEIDQLKEEKKGYLENLVKKDDFFMQHRNETTKIMNRLSDKEKENHELQNEIDSLHKELQKLSDALAVYTEPDRRLLDFRGYGYEGYGYEAPKKNAQGDREVEKLRKDKSGLEIELSAARDKLEDRESRYKIGEEEGRKKLALRERKIQELEQKIAEQKEEQMKGKTQLQLNLQKLQNTINGKNKQIGGLSQKLAGFNDKIVELDKKNKYFGDQIKKKDDKIRQLSSEIVEKGKLINQKEKTIADLLAKQGFDHHIIEQKDKLIEKLQEQRKNIKSQAQIEKAEKNQKTDRIEKGQRQKMKREIEKLKKDNEQIKKSLEGVEKQRDEAVAGTKEGKRKFEELTKKWNQLKSSHGQLEAELQRKIQQLQQKQEAYEEAVKEQAELKKRGEAVGELRNKIIILESRLKQNESQYRDNSEMESMNLQDKLDALELRLEDKEKELKMLRNQLRSSSLHSQTQEDVQMLEMELEEREQCIQRLEAELTKKDKLLEEMKRDLQFKDHTLDFTHKILVNSEKAKIELQQQKKMLEEMLQRSDVNGSFSTGLDDRQELIQFYEAKLQALQGKLQQMDRRTREKEEVDRNSKDEYKFENRQLKERIRELNDTLLSKGKLTPETMSQEETASFLLKTLRRVNKSTDMLRLLGRNPQFREAFGRMERELKK